MTSYLLDANPLVVMGRHMPRDVFTGLWDSLEDLAMDGRLVVHPQVLTELERGGDGLADWVKGIDGMLAQPSLPELMQVQAITDQLPEWVQDQRNAADPWLIAHAETNGLVLVTDESQTQGSNAEQRNLKIPTVARLLSINVEIRGTQDFFRGEGWTFVRG